MITIHMSCCTRTTIVALILAATTAAANEVDTQALTLHIDQSLEARSLSLVALGEVTMAQRGAATSVRFKATAVANEPLYRVATIDPRSFAPNRRGLPRGIRQLPAVQYLQLTAALGDSREIAAEVFLRPDAAAFTPMPSRLLDALGAPIAALPGYLVEGSAEYRRATNNLALAIVRAYDARKDRITESCLTAIETGLDAFQPQLSVPTKQFINSIRPVPAGEPTTHSGEGTNGDETTEPTTVERSPQSPKARPIRKPGIFDLIDIIKR